jgi:hypothetical protein
MGIKATLSRLNAALKVHDRELWYHLEVKNQVCQSAWALESEDGRPLGSQLKPTCLVQDSFAALCRSTHSSTPSGGSRSC